MTALESCVGDPADFIANHWNQTPLLKRHDGEGPGPFADIGSLSDLDRIITTMGLRLPSFRMVKQGEPLPPGSFTRTERGRQRVTEGVIDPSLVLQRFHEGATIVLEGLHKTWEPLARFARELEMDLGHRIQVNAYITPPASQGFAVHEDDHDVFVLQTAGAKRWSVWDREAEGEAVIDHELREGDCLYIPEGFPHAATTAEGISAHLTVGILTHDSLDILRELMKVAEEDVGFAERLPAGALNDPTTLKMWIGERLDELSVWLDKVDRDDFAWRMTRRLATTRQETMSGGLVQAARLGELADSSLVRKRFGATCLLSTTRDNVRVLLADRELQMPIAAAPAMTFVAATDPFRVRDLEVWLDEESRLVLVRRLVREGLLEVVFDG